MVRIFSFGERWNVPFNSAVASLNGTFHLSPHENILTIALINIHYLYIIFMARVHSSNLRRKSASRARVESAVDFSYCTRVDSITNVVLAGRWVRDWTHRGCKYVWFLSHTPSHTHIFIHTVAMALKFFLPIHMTINYPHQNISL
jgi:hypothetical protein